MVQEQAPATGIPVNQSYPGGPRYTDPPVNQSYPGGPQYTGPPVKQSYPEGPQYTGPPVNQSYPGGPQYTGPPVAPATGAWSSGLCDCCDDVPRCCLTWCCPCITFGQVAEIVDKGSSSCGMSGGLYALILAVTGCQWIYSCTYRTKMRKQYGIAGSDAGDCCTHFCCECCALTQMYRELTARGYDVPLGWHGNAGMQNQGVHMAPVAPGGMSR